MKLNHEPLECTTCAKRFNTLFCQQSNDKVEGVEEEKICSLYAKGEYIFRQGTKPQGIYCLNRGKVKIMHKEADGKEKIVRLVKPGDPMGYRSILSEENYSASAIAIEESGVCFIPRELFISVLKKDTSLTMEMIKLLGADLRLAESQLSKMTSKSTLERTAEALLFIKETYGYEEDEKTINASLSRKEIADIVGTNMETVVRQISDFRKQGVISIDNKKIAIEDLPKLIYYANMYD